MTFKLNEIKVKVLEDILGLAVIMLMHQFTHLLHKDNEGVEPFSSLGLLI